MSNNNKIEGEKVNSKKIGNRLKKYRSYQKKIQKELSTNIKRLEVYMKKTSEKLFQYPLNADKNKILKLRSLKHLEYETVIKMLRFKDRALDVILKMLESRLVVTEEEEGEESLNEIKSSKRNCRTVEFLISLFNPPFSDIISMTPKSFFENLGCIVDFNLEIRKIREQEGEERTNLKGVKLMKPSDIKKESYINNMLFCSFSEECDIQYSSLQKEVRLNLDVDNFEEYDFPIFENTVRSFSFFDSRDKYEEKIRVHVENKNTRIYRYVDSIYHISQDRVEELPRGKRFIHFRLFEDGYSFNLESPIDRKFVCLLQNTVITYLVKDLFLRKIMDDVSDSDEKFMDCCSILNETMNNQQTFFVETNDGIFGAELKFLIDKSLEKELREQNSFKEAIESVRRLIMRYGTVYDPMEIIIILSQICCVLATTSRRTCLRNQEKWSFGADDFFPILTYILIRAKIPQFCSLLKYAKAFFSSNFDLYKDFLGSKSELKYYLTVFDAVKDFIIAEGTKLREDSRGFLDWLSERNFKRLGEKNVEIRERIRFVTNHLHDFEIQIQGSSSGRKNINIHVTSIFLYK